MGKFEKNNRPQAQRAAQNAARKSKPKKQSRLPLILGILGSAVVIIACAVGYILLRDDHRIAQNVYVGGINLSGMTKEEAKEALKDVSFDQDMTVRLYTEGDEFPLDVTTYDPSAETVTDIYGKPVENAQTTAAIPQADPPRTDPDAPLDENGNPYLLDQTICLPASYVEITLDTDAAVEEAYRYGRETGSKNNDERIDIDVSKLLTVNEAYIRDVLDSTLDDTTCVGTETTITKTTTTITDKDGSVTEVKASVSGTAAKEAAKTGEAVTLPVEVPAAASTEDAPAVQVSVPKSAGSVKVEIPVEKVTPGTVAVIVNADGTEKIVSTSVVTENGVALPLDGGATVKIIDNAKSSTDVPATNVFYNEISSLSAREIMVGKTDDTFDLNSSVTLNQIANVAARSSPCAVPSRIS